MKKKMIMQKLMGAVMVSASVLSIPFVADDTAAIMFIPLGVFMMLTRKVWIF